MRKYAIVLLAALAFSLAACGSGGGSANVTPTDTTAAPTATTAPGPTDTPATGGTGNSAATVSMAAFSFSGTRDFTIKAGQSVTFDDPASGGGIHNLVTGQNGVYTQVAGAPSQFATKSGMSFAPGTTVAVTFPNAGTFPITCTFHPHMQVTITVTK